MCSLKQRFFHDGASYESSRRDSAGILHRISIRVFFISSKIQNMTIIIIKNSNMRSQCCVSIISGKTYIIFDEINYFGNQIEGNQILYQFGWIYSDKIQ